VSVRPGTVLAVLRGLCPGCRAAPVFRGRFAMHPSCPGCGVSFVRESGYFIGALYFGYALSLPAIIALMLLVHLARPAWSFDLLLLVSVALLAPVAPALFRLARVAWLHLDHALKRLG